jgi:hypothetical protein
MNLENKTPLPARLVVSNPEDTPHRFAMIAAKATFRFDLEGRVEIEGEDPLPIFEKDEETELGLLPRDDMPQPNTAFDVILLGAAHAPNGNPVQQMTVALGVGDERRELAVFGDRRWIDRACRSPGSAPTAEPSRCWSIASRRWTSPTPTTRSAAA